MGTIGTIVLILLVLLVIQVLLSMRQNRYLGWIIPGLNGLMSMVISLMFSDYFSAVLGLLVTVLPIVLWLSVYMICRRRLDQIRHKEIQRMKINDL